MNQGSIFAITPSPDRVRLNQDRKGEVAFTVTSTRGPIRARALVVPQGSARPEWFSLVEPAERFIDGTEQFTVRISVPAGTKAGEYSFLLKVVSEANPDDEFTDGPQVGFEVPASEPPKRFPWWILIVAGAVLLIGLGIAAYFIFRGGDPELGEGCDEGNCGEGLVCSEEDICVGDFRFAGCTADADCAAGLSCAIGEGEDEGMCIGGLGFECDPEAEEGECGPGLVCDQGMCKGDVDFGECTVDADCVGELSCAIEDGEDHGTCVEVPLLPPDPRACERSVQGRIAWNYDGNTSWAPGNVARLCLGAEDSAEPARCFDRVMHGGVNWGAGTRWEWQNAVDLCEGTRDAYATITCFQSRIASGEAWPQAIAACATR